MERSELLIDLVRRITRVEALHPVRVAIDGPDAAGKTTLADELAVLLKSLGRPVIRCSIDGFHNPANIRHRPGKCEPESYYHDSFNYESLIRLILEPLGPGGSLRYRSRLFDYRTDLPALADEKLASANAVLLFDGVFLLRKELRAFWDFRIFIDVAPEVILQRAEHRDAVLFGGAKEVKRRYTTRYLPGQQLYFDECLPKALADVTIDNNDYAKPLIMSQKSGRE